MSEWMSIETAPKDFVTQIDIWAGGRRYTDCDWCLPDDRKDTNDYHWCYSEYERGWGVCYYPVPNPTYWMPIPEPPVETTVQSVKRSESDEPEARA